MRIYMVSPIKTQRCQRDPRVICSWRSSRPVPQMYTAHRYVQPLKRFIWSTHCLASFFVLFVLIAGAAWGQEPTGAVSETVEAAMAGPLGLMSHVGDRSVILRWDAIEDSSLAGYRVYRASSAIGPFAQHSATLSTPYFV